MDAPRRGDGAAAGHAQGNGAAGSACWSTSLRPVNGRGKWFGRVAGGIAAPGSHRSVYVLLAGFAQAQCAKYRGWDAAALLMDWIAFFQVLSFLYLFMIHRSR